MVPALVVAFGLLPRLAEASPNARLVYGRSTEAEICPDEARLRDAVAERVGYDPFFPHAPRTVIVTIAAKGEGLAARIELVDDAARTSGSRELTSRTAGCDDLFESTALAIAIAIDPHALVGPAPAPPADTAHRSPPPPEEPAPRPAHEPDARPAPSRATSSLRLRTSLALRGGGGVQPGLAPGAFAGAAALFRHASLGVEVGGYVPTAAPVAGGGEVRGWLMAGALVPCLRFAPLALCGVLTAGRFEGSGRGVPNPATETALFLGLGVRPGIEAALGGPLHIHLDAEILGNLARSGLKVGPEEVWRASPFAVAIAAGASYDFE